MSVAELRLKNVPAPASTHAANPAPAVAPIELAVIIPTLNERDNVALVVERLSRTLAGIAWEVIFVDDDSPDGTAHVVRDLAGQQGNVRCVQRIGRRGLSSACIEGMLASTAPYLAVMDGDLQHDETLLPRMLAKIKAEHLDIVVASRHIAEGGVANWDKSRVRISEFATKLSRIVVKAELSDPMSGFFLIERSAFDGAMRRLSGQGFKILLDLFASTPRPFAFAELPLQFRERLHGESKLDALVAWEYLMLLLQKLVGPAVPVRFLLFALIGGLGVGVHLTTLWLVLHVAPFATAQAVATVVAMTGNFLLNNLFTYRDRRLKGWRILSGLGSFYAVCGIGAAANVGIAASIAGNHSWWLAGLAGAAVSVVWNYVMSSIFTWSARHSAPTPAPASPR
ncbi:MAG TPA: glycosyltransferase family 2 protein [Stellaceae bacterium]|jgi:dolichol-phosphate mannosyltransferase|nr:glycosyltransferase family 2 protein [Stellaceae bacterium]